jgi:hypothetical protein
VPQNDFDSRLTGLVANLDEATALLMKHGETHWASWLMRDRPGLLAHDVDAFDGLLRAFGGMGSFNDLLILASNGHAVRPDQEKTINERLWDLRELIWTSTTSLRSELSDPAESLGVKSARALLVGREVSAVCFVRDYVELHFDGPIVRAISNPLGSWMARHRGWRYPDGDSATAMLIFIGRVVDGFTFVADQHAQLSFGEDAFTIPLGDEDRRGPEALHIVGVDEDGRTDPRQLWVW